MSCLPSGSWAKSKLVVYFTNFLRNQFACFMFVADGWTFYPKNEKARYVVSYFDVWRLGLMTADGRRLMFCFFPFFDILFTRRQQLLSCVVYRFNIYSHFIHLRCGLALNICVHGRNLGCERYLLASCFSLWSAHLRNCGTRRPIWLTRLIAQVGNDHFECPNRFFPPIEKKIIQEKFRNDVRRNRWFYIWQTLPITSQLWIAKAYTGCGPGSPHTVWGI